MADFGKPPCTCKPGNVVNGHRTWLLNRTCPVHGNPEPKK
jgi:hypothetical protein